MFDGVLSLIGLDIEWIKSEKQVKTTLVMSVLKSEIKVKVSWNHFSNVGTKKWDFLYVSNVAMWYYRYRYIQYLS